MDLATRKRLDVKYGPSAEYRYWLYDPEGDGMTYYRTAEARDEAAKKAIDGYLDDDWHEEVELVAAGEVTHFVQCLDKKQRPADLDDELRDGDGTYWGEYQWMGNYTMAPLACTPTQTLLCPHCGVDRLKQACPDNGPDCPMRGEAQQGAR